MMTMMMMMMFFLHHTAIQMSTPRPLQQHHSLLLSHSLTWQQRCFLSTSFSLTRPAQRERNSAF